MRTSSTPARRNTGHTTSRPLRGEEARRERRARRRPPGGEADREVPEKHGETLCRFRRRRRRRPRFKVTARIRSAATTRRPDPDDLAPQHRQRVRGEELHDADRRTRDRSPRKEVTRAINGLRSTTPRPPSVKVVEHAVGGSAEDDSERRRTARAQAPGEQRHQCCDAGGEKRWTGKPSMPEQIAIGDAEVKPHHVDVGKHRSGDRDEQQARRQTVGAQPCAQGEQGRRGASGASSRCAETVGEEPGPSSPKSLIDAR